MLDTIYSSQTGLLGFSRGLNSISNNVANLNSPGYKARGLAFSDLFYRFESGGDAGRDQSPVLIGQGLNVSSSFTVFRQGDIRQSGNALDAAIDGNGFFIARTAERTLYTRNGSFDVDRDGFVVARDGARERIAALSPGNRLTDMNVSGLRASPGRATATVTLAGNLSVNDSDNSHTVSSISVFDAQGTNFLFNATFRNNGTVTPRSWLIEVTDVGGGPVATGEVRFSGDGSPVAGFNALDVSYQPPAGDRVNFRLAFGEPGSFSGATNFSAGNTSTLAVTTQDGRAAGALTRTAFDARGNLTLTYSNGQVTTPFRLALANFDVLQQLEPVGNSRFANRTDQPVILGFAGERAFGQITPGSVEASNVDLAREFTELIVMQRGYQSSSQALTIANEMIQTLLDLRGRR
jgi:flagellar hook protein FlgE